MKVLFLIAGVLALAFGSRAEASTCTAPTKGTAVAVPGRPFAVVATSDNCWLFVSIETGKNHGAIAVLRNQDGTFGMDHAFALTGQALGESLSHDGQLLMVAAGDDTAVLDVAGLEHGDAKALLGMFHDNRDAGAIYAAVSLDDKLLFVSDEDAQRISVFDLAKARSDNFQGNALIGRIPTAISPIGLALSPDGQWLYATNQVGPATSKLPTTCKPEGGTQMHVPGLLLRIDVAKAMTDPAHAAVAALPAGCNPVRVAVSPSGKQVWVTARGDNALLRFQADDWLGGTTPASYTNFPIGANPVGVAVRPDGKQVWVALSNRFGKDKDSAGRLAGLTIGASDSSMMLMSAPAAGFPREVIFLPDGHTMVATLFDAKQVEFIPTPD